MQLKQLIQDICEYAVRNEVVECAMGGLSLYEVNFKDNNNYPLLFISPSTNHTISNNTITYQIVIYYIDRLLKDNDNNIDIVNASVSKLQQIINIIRNFDNVLKLNSDFQITNFADTQRLTDCVAGAYVNLSITTENTQGICAVDAVLPTIKVVLQNKNVEITENGEYEITFDKGYTGLKEVKVDVNIDTDSFYQEGYEEGFSKGETEGYNEGYTEGDANGREQQKSLLESIKITENGIYDNENGYDEITVEVDTSGAYNEGFDKGKTEGIEQGKEEGKAEQKSLIQPITITENGVFSNENGYSPIDVKLDTDSYFNNGYNEGFSKGETEGYETGYNEGYSEGEVNGVEQGKEEQKSLLEPITITENGVFTNENGYSEITVDVPTGGGDAGDYEEGYNKGYEEGVANAEEEIAETAQVLHITENGRYTTKFSEMSDSDAVVTGYFDDGTPFYNYGFCNEIGYNTGIKVSPTTKLEVWYKTDNWEEVDTAIVATQTSANYGAIFKIVKDRGKAKAEISRIGITTPNPMVNGEWYHLKLSYEEGFWVNDEFIGDMTNNVTGTAYELCINAFRKDRLENYTSNAYYGMIKIDNQIIIPTEQGFYNVTTDTYLDAVTTTVEGEYLYTEVKPNFTGNLIKEVIVDVPTTTVEGEYTQEEVDEMCTSVYEASSEILDYLNSTGESVEYTIEENGHYTYEADTYFNEVTINIKVPTSSGEGALHNFNDLGYQTDDVVYMGNPATMKDDLDYSYNKKENFDGSPTYFDNDTQLVYAPMVDLNLITSESMYQFFYNCQNMVATPTYTLPSRETKLERTFEQCQSLKYVKLIGDNITELDNTFSNCNSLITFDLETKSDSIGLNSAFNNCQNLEYIPKIGNLGEFNRVANSTFIDCYKLKKIENVINPTVTDSTEQPHFIDCYSLEDVKIKINDSNNFLISLDYSPKLKWDCVKYMIDNAVEGGSHIIYLHSSLEEKYNQEPDYQDYMSLATSKGISISFANRTIPEEYL